MLGLEHAAINIGTKTSLGQLAPNTCPVKRGVSAASFDAAGLGERTGHVYIAQHDDYLDIYNFHKFT